MIKADAKRAVAYLRVSNLSQVDGHSLDAQGRLFRQLCDNRVWEDLRVYREEGASAHSESIKKRPAFRQLMEDAKKGEFDIVVVHTLERGKWVAQACAERGFRFTTRNHILLWGDERGR